MFAVPIKLMILFVLRTGDSTAIIDMAGNYFGDSPFYLFNTGAHARICMSDIHVLSFQKKKKKNFFFQE